MAPPLPLDVPLGAGQARAGKVQKPSELIGGPVAYGRAGDVWKLYNSKARFLIQDIGTSVGLDIYGGNLIDADLVRPGDDGSNGNDLFRETFPIVGLHVMDPASIEVVADGSKGGAAHLRVSGADAPSMILPQIDDVANDLGGQIVTDYVLDPDVPYLKIVTTYNARQGQSLDSLLLGDFLSFGASLTVISPENGFSQDAGTVTFLGAIGDGTSYGYVYPDGNIKVPLVDASGTVTLLKSDPLPQDGSVSLTRYLVIGDGDAASVMGQMYALHKLPTAHLSGTVRDEAGAPAAGVRVTLFHAPFGAMSTAVDQANSRSDGSYAFDVPPGDYVAITSGAGRLRGTPVPVTLTDHASLDLLAGATGQAVLDIGEMHDGQRAHVPAKVSFLGQDVEQPDPRFGPDPTETERNGVHAVALSPDGMGKVTLKPGTYDVVVSRGVEYELGRLSGLVVPQGGSVPVQVDLMRVVDTTGWLAGDYHQHSQGSIDSPVPILQRVTEDLAEGIEFPAGTDHDNIIDFRPYIARLSAQAFINAVPGDEVSVNGVGHFNAYPLAPVDLAAQDPYARVGAKLWARDTVAGFTTRLRKLEPADIIVHVSHPRTKSLAGYFNTVHFDPTTGKSSEPLDIFDAVEVNGDLGQPADFLLANDANVHKLATMGQPTGIATLRDWFALLNLGRPVCALGNSDTHFRNGGTGYPRNFVLLHTDDPQKATGAQLVAAIRGQQVTVSHGPVVTVTVNGKQALGKGQVVSLAGAGSALLGVKVQAPSWIDVGTLEVYENGRPLSLMRTGPGSFAAVDPATPGATLQIALAAGDGKDAVVRLDGTVKVTPTRDAWYVVVVRGSGSMLPVAGGTPYAYTNPVYLDTASDGWTAPLL